MPFLPTPPSTSNLIVILSRDAPRFRFVLANPFHLSAKTNAIVTSLVVGVPVIIMLFLGFYFFCISIPSRVRRRRQRNRRALANSRKHNGDGLDNIVPLQDIARSTVKRLTNELPTHNQLSNPAYPDQGSAQTLVTPLSLKAKRLRQSHTHRYHDVILPHNHPGKVWETSQKFLSPSCC
ncbi:hypothetical protein B0H34DRAFT_63885 [Crassisporium funariophilum]|nr:hypothetical protein B0H34DRAFT_63885 [Crassisporium funariophilum]